MLPQCHAIRCTIPVIQIFHSVCNSFSFCENLSDLKIIHRFHDIARNYINDILVRHS